MATSTYSDSTSATYKGAWILVGYDPGYEMRSSPLNETITERRKHNTLRRYRYLKGSVSYASQEGQVGVGSDLTSYYGDGASGAPVGTNGYLCTEDSLAAEEPGTGIAVQAQTWEHFSPWEGYDLTALES